MATYRTTIINGRNCCWSPHLRVNPTDRANPSPDVLPPEARRLWDATRANAHSYYSGAWDLADMAAWRAVKMKYPNGIGQWRPMRNPAPLKQTAVPDPGEQIELGRVLEYVVEEAPPRLDVYRFKDDAHAPKLLWSKSQKMLLILPQDNISEDRNPDLTGLEQSANLFRSWAWGQQPRGFVVHPVDSSQVKPLGMADTIVYRSSKGHKTQVGNPVGSQNYIHQFGDDVVVFQGPNTSSPKAIMIRGGDLDVQEPGIIN